MVEEISLARCVGNPLSSSAKTVWQTTCWPWWRVNVYGATNVSPWTRQRTMSNAVESWRLNAPDVMQLLKGQTETAITMSVWWRTFNVNVGFCWKGQKRTNTGETRAPYKKSSVHSNVEKQLKGLFCSYTLHLKIRAWLRRRRFRKAH